MAGDLALSPIDPANQGWPNEGLGLGRGQGFTRQVSLLGQLGVRVSAQDRIKHEAKQRTLECNDSRKATEGCKT